MELPFAWNAFELVLAGAGEREPAAYKRVLDRLRDKDLAGTGLVLDPRPDHDSDPADLASDELTLADVDPCAYIDTDRMHTVAYGESAADRARGGIERGP